MSRDRHWQLAITPLSPVHLGSGQDYEPSGYVIDEGALFEFDGLAALKTLPEAERTQLGKILDGTPDQGLLRRVQGFFYRNRERLIPVSRRAVRISPAMESFYQERIGQVAQREAGGREVQNRLEIERTAFNPANGMPIIPGSGLKGAIRTALLDSENGGKSLRQAEDRRGGTRKENNQELQQRLFRYRAGQFQLDPMRLVRLADAAPAHSDAVTSQVSFAVNRKKHPGTADGRLVDSQAEQKGLYQLLECLPRLEARAFRGQISIQDTSGLESAHWPDKSLRFDLERIAAACNGFFRPILDEEMDLLRERGLLNESWAETVRSLLEGPFASAVESNKAFLLRVGRHSGAESVTLNGVRNIKIIKGAGERPEYLPAAKTIWLAAEEPGQQQDLLPFGWLLVEVQPSGGDLPELSLPRGPGDLVDWRNRIDARRRQLNIELVRIRERELSAQRKREAAARDAEARAVRLEALSAEARELERLRELLAKERASGTKQAGGDLSNSLVKLLKEAVDAWPVKESHQLAELGEEIYAYLGWPKSKQKKRDRRAQIETLRARSE